MNKKTVITAVQTKDGVIAQIRTGGIYQPAAHFQGGTVKWYEDKKRMPAR